MVNKILELITGKDDLERVACKNDCARLNAYLRTRTLQIPKVPRRFLDAATFTQEELIDLMREEAEELGGDSFEPWIVDMDGKKILPAFSSEKKMQVFSAKMSQDMDKVFALGCVSILLKDMPQAWDIDVVFLNLFCKQSWEIGVKDNRTRCSKDR